jgi:uncharacterized repeat protein (TIGR01451 family)
VFAVNTDGTGFTNLYSFSAIPPYPGPYINSDGAEPHAGLILSGNTLYGTTDYGGTNGSGTVFAINTDGTGFTNLYIFTAESTNSSGVYTNSDGANPLAGLILSGNTLYGTASAGGTNGSGTVFAINIDGAGFTNLHSFNGPNDGANPLAGLILSSNTLYGTASAGGSGGSGTVFQINTNGTGFRTLYSFTAGDPYFDNSNGDGAVPSGSLLLIGGILYGTAAEGGLYGEGTIFSLSLGSAPLVVTTTSLPSGTKGTAYSQTLAASGGQTPYSWMISSGALPNGLTLATSGVISGAPTAGGMFNFTAKVTDALSSTATQALVLQINLLDTTIPTNTISAPTANQRWSNAVFTVTGTARDNVGVTNVFYALNNSAWASADTADNWTNWTAAVTLTPGTNTIQAYAVDSSGNISLTNTVKFVYILSAVLTVQTNGDGTVTPNDNGATLQIGASYEMKATAATGFGFTNWTGGTNLPLSVITNGATVQFLMVSNLTLQANFVDTARPTNTISAPTANQRWSNSVFTVTGTARDNVGVTNVFYSLDGSAWATAGTANNWTNWTAVVNLTAGTNTIAVYAVDNSGNVSTTNTVKFVYVVSSAVADLSLSASGPVDSVQVGGNLAYSITVSNAGPSTASGVVVSNRIPAGVTFVSASGGSTPSGGVLLLNLGSLAVGATNLVQIVVQPTFQIVEQSPSVGQPGGEFTNVFKVFANQTDPVPANNSATVVSFAYAPFPGTPIAWTDPGGATIGTYSIVIGSGPIEVGAGGNPATTGQAGDIVLLIDSNGGTNPTNWAAVARFFNPGDPTGTNGLAATDSEAFFATNLGGGGFAGFQLFPDTAFIPEGADVSTTNGVTTIVATYEEFGPEDAILAGQTDVDVLTISLPPETNTVTITSPVPGQVETNQVIDALGTTTITNGQAAVSNVLVQLNNGGWFSAVTANSWTNWESDELILTPGSNTVQAYALDTNGNVSATNTVIFDYVVTAGGVFAGPPGTPTLDYNNPGGDIITILEGGGIGVQLITNYNNSSFSAFAGDVVMLIDPNGGNNPTNWEAVMNFFNPGDPTGSNGLAATEYLTFFPTNAGPDYFANFPLLPNVIYVPVIQTNADGSITAGSTVFGPAGGILSGQEAIIVYTAAIQPNTGADLSLNASAAPQPVRVGSNLVYTLLVTNLGPSSATGVVISNQLPAGVTFVSASGGSTPSGGVLLLNLGSLAVNAGNLVQIVVQPTAAGALTNVFEVFANETDPVPANNSATVVSTVTTTAPASVDVALSIMAAPDPVGVGAPLTYSLTVTNNSSTTATGVVVSNTLPTNVTLISVLPSQGSAGNNAGVVTFTVGSLPNGTAATLAIVVVPNDAGLLTNDAVAFSTQPDSQPTNNSVQIVTTALTMPITNLILTVLSPITLNPQTGLFEQSVEVSNGGPATPSSVLVLVSGLAANARLYNADGITNGTPYVQSASPLGVGSNVVFLLEYYVPTRVAPTNLTLSAQGGPPVTPPIVSGTILSISRTIVLSNGSVLIEFSAIPGRIYAIQYSSDMATWRTALPAITAPANKVQWIDAGPPKTDSNPAQQSARYYRVVLLAAN